MSQDLFAAFGVSDPEHDAHNLHQKPTQSQLGTFTASKDATGVLSHVAQKDPPDADSLGELDEDDDFGDFEDAPAPSNHQPDVIRPSTNSMLTRGPTQANQTGTHEPKDSRIGKHPFAAHMDLLFSADDDEYDAGADDLEDLSKNPEAAVAYSKRIIEEQLGKQSRSEQQLAFRVASGLHGDSKAPNNSQVPHKISQPHSHERPPKNPNVLFDADDVTDESDDDDFGDFEDAPPSNTSVSGNPEINHVEDPSTSPVIDLLGLNDDAKPSSTSMPYSTRVTRHVPTTSTSRHTDISHTTLSVPNQASSNEDESWDDFEEVEPASKLSFADSANATTTIVAVRSKIENGSQKEHQGGSSPPTNIPPPIILLSIFPSIFATAREVLFDPLSKLELADRQQLLAHPATVKFLRSYLTAAVVLGHIIAGRKFRWKRDQYLVQSMRIGPASAGGKGGMKLAGLDKTEAAKEEGEVLDVIRLWRAQIGKLRGAVSTVSMSKTPAVQKLPPVPDISDPTPIKTLKAVQGGFTAPHSCALCGLKREERVAKIDIDINDSFGEWWLDGSSMHFVCHNFWLEHKDKLKSR